MPGGRDVPPTKNASDQVCTTPRRWLHARHVHARTMQPFFFFLIFLRPGGGHVRPRGLVGPGLAEFQASRPGRACRRYRTARPNACTSHDPTTSTQPTPPPAQKPAEKANPQVPSAEGVVVGGRLAHTVALPAGPRFHSTLPIPYTDHTIPPHATTPTRPTLPPKQEPYRKYRR